MTEHEHRWTFLRQEEERQEGWGGRTREWRIYDYFFCDGCLAYDKKQVRIEEPSSDYYGRRTVTWRAVP